MDDNNWWQSDEEFLEALEYNLNDVYDLLIMLRFTPHLTSSVHEDRRTRGPFILAKTAMYTLAILELCLQEPFAKCGLIDYDFNHQRLEHPLFDHDGVYLYLVQPSDSQLSTLALELMETNQKLAASGKSFEDLLRNAEPMPLSKDSIGKTFEQVENTRRVSLERALVFLNDLDARKVAVAHSVLLNAVRIIRLLTHFVADPLIRWNVVDYVPLGSCDVPCDTWVYSGTWIDESTYTARGQLDRALLTMAERLNAANEGLIEIMESDTRESSAPYISRLALNG